MDLPVVTIMFDDGFSEVYDEAFPLLENLGYKANVALIGSKINDKGYLTIEKVKELLTKGWGLSDHTFSHMNLQRANVQIIEREIVRNRRFVSEVFGHELEDFVFPQSRISHDSLSLVFSFYDVAFTGTYRIQGNSPPFRHKLLTRVEFSEYGSLVSYVSLSSFTHSLKNYLKQSWEQRRPEWLILFTHRVTNRPRLFDVNKKRFSDALNLIDATSIPVTTTTQVINSLL